MTYEKKAYDRDRMKNHFLPVVSKHHKSEHVATIHQDMTIYFSLLDADKTLTFQQEENRKIFFFVIEGDVVLDDEHALNRRDSARIANVPSLTINNEGSFFMLIDLPYVSG